MLELKNIGKSYLTGTFKQKALNDIDINFRKNEFVAVLGPSGSGKTTLLNIIGGLDKYDNGDLIINGKSTKQFKDRDWDSYRNNAIGFVFQNYNLISHISILDNVEMSMTLSGISKKRRYKKALDALKKVGLEQHIHKKPNQLSGGQMQRVAIARALVNDPDIILADEPTGALDSKTSIQIMELIKEISKDKLVIMVTHNSELAKEYASRIVELRDGNVISDTDKDRSCEEEKNYSFGKTAMGFITALSLSFNNIKTKKGRTILTAFASSIGIIGIAIILSLSNGFQIQIDKFEKETLSSLPILISEDGMEVDTDQMQKIQSKVLVKNIEYPKEEVIYPYDPLEETTVYKNTLTKEYMDYIEKLDSNLVAGISYTRAIGLNLITNYNKFEISKLSNYLLTAPFNVTNKTSYLKENYTLLAGNFPSQSTDLLLLVDNYNRVNMDVLKALGFVIDADEFIEGKEYKIDDYAKYNDKIYKCIKETNKFDDSWIIFDTSKISFNELIGKEIRLVLNDDFYASYGNIFIPNVSDLESLYEKGITLKISGIIRGNEDNLIAQVIGGGYMYYTEDLIDYVVSKNSESKIVKAQTEVNYNVLTGELFDESEDSIATKNTLLSYLGKDKVPMIIGIYPIDFDSKDEIIKYLDDYNKTKMDDAKNQTIDYINQLNEKLKNNYDESLLNSPSKSISEKLPTKVNFTYKDGLSGTITIDNKYTFKIKNNEINETEDNGSIIYNDMASTISMLSGQIMDAITYVLLAFSAISLIVSSIMIGIITYISVLERTKEIGILRALGARKKDITRVFNAETFIIGLCSGLIGVIIARLLLFPMNIILEKYTNLINVAQMSIMHVIILLIVSVALTLIGGLIPALLASKKDPVEALRTE